MKVKRLSVRVDSLLVAHQVKGDFEVREGMLYKYVDKAKELLKQFDEFEFTQIPRSQNKKADALSKLASLAFAHLTKQAPVEVIKSRTDSCEEVDIVQAPNQIG
jgi:ribonuclease HI